jgi:DNA (cytosine-5)-methyltransferase 1
MIKKIEAISLFSSAGIGELFLEEVGIEIKIANEIIEKRAECYKHFFPNTKVITGDIRDPSIKKQIISSASKNTKLLIATPPCQGLSSLGKNKNQESFENDERNFLIFDAFEIIDKLDLDYILFENVPKFLDMYFPFKTKVRTLVEILEIKYGQKFKIESSVLDSQFYGVPQTRPRAIIKMYKPNLTWLNPKKTTPINLEHAIGHLPSIEAGMSSNIPLHSAKPHDKRIIQALKHTPTGKSALQNKIHFPKKENGEKIKGFHNTYKRMTWDHPAHARTTYSGSLSSHNNVHPGRPKKDGTYSDARVLTILETFIVHSMKENTHFPEWATDTFIRQAIGESIPPLLLKKVLEGILKGKN